MKGMLSTTTRRREIIIKRPKEKELIKEIKLLFAANK